MGFVVTARKYRPLRFENVVGQEHITNTLKNAISRGRIAHAYLFTGPRGVGKTTTARILSKAVNCLSSKDSEPCDQCEVCKLAQNSQLLDITEIDAASNRGIDEIRALRESVKYAPTRGKYKVYIIDEVHMLTKDSFNAFLKTLEEPPEHTIFIFATTDVHKLPLTIISRCQRYDFRRIPVDTIKQLLNEIAKTENIQIDDKTLTLIARKSDGGLRDAESFFDQAVAFCGDNIDYQSVIKVFNFIDDEIYFRTTTAILQKNFKSAFDIANQIYENGWNFIDYIDGLIEHFRNMLTVNISGGTDLIETAIVFKEQYLRLQKKFSNGDILRALNFCAKLNQELKFSQNHKLKVEVALSHLIGFERTSTFNELLKLIESGADLKLKRFDDFSENENSITPPPLKQTEAKSIQQQSLPKSEAIHSSHSISEQPVTYTATTQTNGAMPRFFNNSAKQPIANNHFEPIKIEEKIKSDSPVVYDEDPYIMGIVEHLRGHEIQK